MMSFWLLFLFLLFPRAVTTFSFPFTRSRFPGLGIDRRALTARRPVSTRFSLLHDNISLALLQPLDTGIYHHIDTTTLLSDELQTSLILPTTPSHALRTFSPPASLYTTISHVVAGYCSLNGFTQHAFPSAHETRVISPALACGPDPRRHHTNHGSAALCPFFGPSPMYFLMVSWMFGHLLDTCSRFPFYS